MKLSSVTIRSFHSPEVQLDKAEYWIPGKLKSTVCQFQIYKYSKLFVSLSFIHLLISPSEHIFSTVHFPETTLFIFYCQVLQHQKYAICTSLASPVKFSVFLWKLKLSRWFRTAFAYCSFSEKHTFSSYICESKGKKQNKHSVLPSPCANFLKDRGKPLSLSVTVT